VLRAEHHRDAATAGEVRVMDRLVGLVIPPVILTDEAGCPVDLHEPRSLVVYFCPGVRRSTTYRYIQTWVALGLAEQNPKTRVYRRAPGTGRRPERAGSDAAQ
jgi:hypothetical protein